MQEITPPPAETRTKEQIYDQEITPLIDLLQVLCKKHDLAMFTTFDVTEPSERAKQGKEDSFFCKMANAHAGHLDMTSPYAALCMIFKSGEGVDMLNSIASAIPLIEKLKSELTKESKVTH